jgi:hypothetical protein
LSLKLSFVPETRVARFFLVHDTKTRKNVPNEYVQSVPHDHKIFQNIPKVNIPNKIYSPKFTQKWCFGFENKPSGNPA